MSNETLFTTKANDYAKSRPSYAAEAIDFITRRLLSAGDRVADIGSGTGIFSAELLRRGYQVFCVEPNDNMRAKAEAALGGMPGFYSVAATAEKTSLPEGQFHLVTAASAFHWFDAEAFRTECRRILAPGGQVCLLINARVYDDFTWQQHNICRELCDNFQSLKHGAEKTEARADTFFAPGWQVRRFSFPLRYTTETFVSRSLSSSYAPDPDSDRGRAFAARLRQLAETTAREGCLTVANDTILLWGTPR